MTDAVLFDLDGVLLDSERPGLALLLAHLRGAGVAVELPELRAVCGRPRAYLRGFVAERLAPVGIDPDAFVAHYDAAKQELFARGEVRLFPGALPLLGDLRRRGWRLALATSTERPRAVARLAGTGLLDAFDATVTGDEVSRGKPAPDIFLLAAERLDVEPGGCWVVEDSLAGLEAGRGAGMRVIAVAGTFERGSLGAAEHVVDDLSEVGGLVGRTGGGASA